MSARLILWLSRANLDGATLTRANLDGVRGWPKGLPLPKGFKLCDRGCCVQREAVSP